MIAIAACALLVAPPACARFTAPPLLITPAVPAEPFTVPEPAAPPAAVATPDNKLDIEGMRRFVRELPVEETSSGPAGTVFSAAPAPERERFNRKFDEGKRAWCLTAFQGLGVLALVAMPLASILDKKDHGCKW